MAKRIIIAGACRTPFGKFGESLKKASAQKLLSTCFAESVKRSGINPDEINEAVAGSCSHLSDAANIARVSWLLAGLPEDKPAYSDQMNCGSGIWATVLAVRAILAGDGEVFLVGGTESMSNIPAMLKRESFNYNTLTDVVIKNSLTEGLTEPTTGELMWQIAENTAVKYGISREDQDEFAAQSHQRAYESIRSGKFQSQIVPVIIESRNMLGEITSETISEDKGPNPNFKKQMPGLMPTLYQLGINGVMGTPEQIEKSTVTARNSCPLTDGAASFLVLTLERAEKLGIKPQAEILSWGSSALSPSYMGEGPNLVIPKLLQKAGRTLDDIDVFEINEAFAATTIAVQRVLNIPMEKLNINGGAIALGHPVGATGAILTVKAIHLMKDLDKNLALISLCVGGGQGAGIVIKNWR